MILISYIAVMDNPLLVSHASHFVSSFIARPPGFEHRLVIICNGGKLPPKMKPIFSGVKHELFSRENDGGWDVSAYIDAAKQFPSELQVCLGESVYFHRAEWLERLVDCYTQHGEGMYGFFSSFLVRPHLQTTAFAVSPKQLIDYPTPRDKAARYEFEHGVNSLWRRVQAKGGRARLVTWDGCWEPKDWRKPDNILWRGNQSNCLMKCNHTDKFDGATQTVRQRWALGADSLCV